MILRMIRFTMFVALAVVSASAQSTPFKDQLEAVFPDAYALYLDLHQHPELSSHETRTAALLAQRLRQLGYEVTENVGGTGVVGIMKNGSGPIVMLRTELDAFSPSPEMNSLKPGKYGKLN
jgi:hippurate hydrolase